MGNQLDFSRPRGTIDPLERLSDSLGAGGLFAKTIGSMREREESDKLAAIRSEQLQYDRSRDAMQDARQAKEDAYQQKLRDRVDNVQNLNADVTNINTKTASQGAFRNGVNSDTLDVLNAGVTDNINKVSTDFITKHGSSDDKAKLESLRSEIMEAGAPNPKNKWGSLTQYQQYDVDGNALDMDPRERAVIDRLNNEIVVSGINGGTPETSGSSILSKAGMDKYKDATVALDAVAANQFNTAYDAAHAKDPKVGTKGRELIDIQNAYERKTGIADKAAAMRGEGGTDLAKYRTQLYNKDHKSNLSLAETLYSGVAKDGHFDGSLNGVELNNKTNAANMAETQGKQVDFNRKAFESDRDYNLRVQSERNRVAEANARLKLEKAKMNSDNSNVISNEFQRGIAQALGFTERAMPKEKFTGQADLHVADKQNVKAINDRLAQIVGEHNAKFKNNKVVIRNGKYVAKGDEETGHVFGSAVLGNIVDGLKTDSEGLRTIKDMSPNASLQAKLRSNPMLNKLREADRTTKDVIANYSSYGLHYDPKQKTTTRKLSPVEGRTPQEIYDSAKTLEARVLALGDSLPQAQKDYALDQVMKVYKDLNVNAAKYQIVVDDSARGFRDMTKKEKEAMQKSAR